MYICTVLKFGETFEKRFYVKNFRVKVEHQNPFLDTAPADET
jgi:hypothetical protein